MLFYYIIYFIIIAFLFLCIPDSDPGSSVHCYHGLMHRVLAYDTDLNDDVYRLGKN